MHECMSAHVCVCVGACACVHVCKCVPSGFKPGIGEKNCEEGIKPRYRMVYANPPLLLLKMEEHTVAYYKMQIYLGVIEHECFFLANACQVERLQTGDFFFLHIFWVFVFKGCHFSKTFLS